MNGQWVGGMDNVVNWLHSGPRGFQGARLECLLDRQVYAWQSQTVCAYVILHEQHVDFMKNFDSLHAHLIDIHFLQLPEFHLLIHFS